MRLDAGRSGMDQARRRVAGILAGTRWAAVTSDVQLVLSELATNALLHGAPPVVVRLRVGDVAVRVEVSDGSQVAPVRPPANGESLTGRGMALVAAAAARWAVEIGPVGKVVWADIIGEERGQDPSGPHARRAVPEQDPTGPVGVLVVLGDVPTDLLLAAKNHVDGLVREFALAAGGAAAGTSGALRTIVDRPTADEAGRLFCYALTEDRWAIGGAVNNAGSVVRWA